MSRLLSLFTLVFILSHQLSFAQLSAYSSVSWEVQTDSSLSNNFHLVMILKDRNGAEKRRIQPGGQSNFWKLFTFKSPNIIEVKDGIGSYMINKSFQDGPDSILVEATCDWTKYNSSFYVPIRYCTSLETDRIKGIKGVYTPWHPRMNMNTGETFDASPDWVDWSYLEQSKAGVIVTPDSVLVEQWVTADSIDLRLVHNKLNKVICAQMITVSPCANLIIDFSGKDGKYGRGGLNAEAWSYPGGHGENGSNGEDGAHIKVYIRSNKKDTSMLECMVFGNNRIERRYVFKSNVYLEIDVSGGNGGAGGNGGKGGFPTTLPDSEYPYTRSTSPSGGEGGQGGFGGDAGNGGSACVFIENGLVIPESHIVVNCKGGQGGLAGAGGLNGSLTKRSAGGIDGFPGRDGFFIGFAYLSAAQINQAITEELYKDR